MSKGRYLKETIKKKVPIWPFLSIIVILAVAAAMYFMRGGDLPASENSISTSAATESQEDAVPETTEAVEETAETTEPLPTQILETQEPIVIVERADAEYEKWLSAALVVCVSMEYPDFQIDGIYAASATSLDDKFTSDGAYIIFTSDGSQMAYHAKALEAERTEAGTVDISTEAIGFATFDSIDAASIDTSKTEPIALEDLDELISQSLLVSIYTH